MFVASSRVRELKLAQAVKGFLHPGRILTGAWIETVEIPGLNEEFSRILTGAWIETGQHQADPASHPRRILTGAWIETLCDKFLCFLIAVASSRVRELKP